MDENANKLHFKFTAFNFAMRVTVYAELCVSRIFKISSIQRHSYLLSLNVGSSEKSRLLCGCVWWLCQLCLYSTNFSTAYKHHALSSFFQEIRLSTSLLCTYLNTNFIKVVVSSSLNTMLFVDEHCNDICCHEFLEPQIDHNTNK